MRVLSRNSSTLSEKKVASKEELLPMKLFSVSMVYSALIRPTKYVCFLSRFTIKLISNQSYFRETGLPPVLLSLLFFPPNLPPDVPAPQEFALQFWDDPKLTNALAVVAIIGLLVGSKGSGVRFLLHLFIHNPISLEQGQESYIFTRCLIEIALASNSPTTLKTQALHLLPANLNFPLSEHVITPYMPVPETNGEEWDRLESASALDALVELALNGEYNGQESAKRLMSGLELRTAAVGVFEVFHILFSHCEC